MHKRILFALGGTGAAALAVACGWFTDDPVADLNALIVDAPVTTLSIAEVGAAPEIPPLRPGELEGGITSGEGLQILGLAPRGPERDPSQVAVIFDRPMVALTELAESGPIECSPKIEGRLRWAGTSTAVIIPVGGRFPSATSYACKVPAGTAALDGTALASTVAWTFATETPALERSWPNNGESAWDEKQPLVLRFNQAVSPASVQRFVQITDSAGAAVAFTAASATENRPGIDATSTVELLPKLARDTEYTVRIPAGFTGEEGSLPSTGESAFSFHTTPKPGIVRTTPTGINANPESSINIQFATEVNGKSLTDKVHISPAPPDGWKPAESWSSQYWYYSPRLKPQTAYTVTVDAGVEDVHGQKLETGTSFSFTTGDLSPTLDTPWSSSELYPAANPTTLPIRFRNVSSVSVEIERLNPTELVTDALQWRNRMGTEGNGRRVQIAATQQRNVLQRAMVDLAPDLVGGYGILRLTAAVPEIRTYDNREQERVAILQVTNLGANVKLTPDGATVWVTQLDTGASVPDANVLISRTGHPPWTGTTDRDGLAVAKGEFYSDNESEWSGDPMMVLVAKGADAAIVETEMTGPFGTWEQGIYRSFDPDGAEVRVRGFADRGVYKPGDPVHFAANARMASIDGLVPTPGRTLRWRLQDPESTLVSEGESLLSATGGFEHDLVLPNDARIGDWTVVVEVDGLPNGNTNETYISIPVRAYRAPSFRVDVTAPERAVIGDSLSASAGASYLFGTPMQGAKAKWSIRRMPLSLSFEGFEDFSFAPQANEDLWSPESYNEEPVSTGTGTLDESGKLAIQQALTAAPNGGAFTYLVETTVTDADRQQVSGRSSTIVDSADAYAGLKMESSLAEAGKPVAASIVALKNTGEPANGTSVKLTAIRRTWDTVRERAMDGTWRWVSSPKEESIATGSVGASGKAQIWSFTPESGGYYIVRAETKDKKGRLAIAETSVWVYGGDVSWARSDNNELELVPDRKEYRPGDTAHILIKGPKKGLKALVTVEREGIFTRNVITLGSTAATVDIPITAAMAPNAFVSVVAAEGAPPADELGAGVPAVWYGLARLPVSAKAQRIDVSLSTDKPTYQPRESVTVALEATQAGKALQAAHVVLWAVDYGVLSLTAYQTPDLFSLFYTERPLGVLTADNRSSIFDRALRLAKGADVGGGGGEGSSAAVRNNFVTTPLWEGSLATGADGKLRHTFPLPDNLTTFRVMAVVDDGKAGFGSSETELRVNRPLIARPALPRFFRSNDRALAGVVVHNNTESAVSVDVTAIAQGAMLHGAPRTVSVEANGAVEVPFGITDFTASEVKFSFGATGGGNTDAVEWTVPMRAARPTEIVATAGSTESTATVSIELPADILRETGGLDVSVSASALVGIGTSVDYVVDYPHGCMEQTTSRMRVAMAALRVREKAGIGTPVAELQSIVTAGLSRIATFRTAGGGFAYWPGDYRSDPLATAYAAEALAEARAAGHTFDISLLEGAQVVLREVLAGKHLPHWYDEETAAAIRARAALALARSGKPDAGYTQRIASEFNKLPNFAKAQTLETLARNNARDPRIAGILTSLEADLHIESTSASLVDKDRSRWRVMWWGEDVASIEFIRALLVAKPTHPLLSRLVSHVVKARKQGRWSNTWSTAEALTALADYTQGFESGAVQANVQRGTASLFTDNLGQGGQKSVSVPMNLLDNSPLLFKAGGGRLYYESRLSYARPTLPPRDEGFTVERSMAVIDGSGGTGRVEPGSLVRVTLRIVTPVDRYNVAVVDSLPAGLEPVDTSFATEATDLQQDTGSQNRDTGTVGPDAFWWSSWIFNRRELRDDEVVWFADYMPAGIHTQSWIARATTPGNYAHPAATAYEMYAPDIFGRTEAGRFVVGSVVAKR